MLSKTIYCGLEGIKPTSKLVDKKKKVNENEVRGPIRIKLIFCDVILLNVVIQSKLLSKFKL